VDVTVADGFVYLVAEMPCCDKNKIELTVEGRNMGAQLGRVLQQA
jgi:HSP20 family molecular chaperone IbpA